MKRLKVEAMGTKVQGVRLMSDPRNPEPESFRVCIPGGDVDIVRCDRGDYWVHIRVNRPDDGADPGREFAKIEDTRLDYVGKHAATTATEGEIKDPGLYHLAVRVVRSR